RQEQRLVRVDVPHPSEHPLIEQQRLDLRLTAPAALVQQRPIDAERVRPQALEARLGATRPEPTHLAELAHVAKQERGPAVLELDLQMSVLVRLKRRPLLGVERRASRAPEQARTPGIAGKQLPGHPEVEQ